MKRFFSFLAGIVLAVIVVLLILIFFGWSRIPDIVASKLSKSMKVPVEIENIQLSLSSIGIEKLEIGNPPGYVLPKAFSVEQLNIKAPLSHYFDNRVVIDEVSLQGIYLGLELQGPLKPQGNWTTIMSNLKASTDAQKGSQKTFLIKKLILTGINVDLVYKTEGGKIRHLPPIARLEYDNVTSEGGVPTEAIANLVLRESLKSIIQQQNLPDLLQGIMQNPSSPSNYLKPLQKLFGQ